MNHYKKSVLLVKDVYDKRNEVYFWIIKYALVLHRFEEHIKQSIVYELWKGQVVTEKKIYTIKFSFLYIEKI